MRTSLTERAGEILQQEEFGRPSATLHVAGEITKTSGRRKLIYNEWTATCRWQCTDNRRGSCAARRRYVDRVKS